MISDSSSQLQHRSQDLSRYPPLRTSTFSIRKKVICADFKGPKDGIGLMPLLLCKLTVLAFCLTYVSNLKFLRSVQQAPHTHLPLIPLTAGTA